METMEAMADHDLSVFMGRMDKLCQRLSDWKSAMPQRSQSRSTSQSLANRSRQLSSHLRQLEGQGLARSFVKLRQQTETPSSGSRLWNNGGSQEGTKARVERAETPILKLSTRGSPPASRSSKALVSILPYSAKDWLNDEAKVSQVSQVSQTERTLKPSGERVEAPQPPELAKNEWQRSRNKLIDGSPSRRSRVESKSPKRTNPSLSPSSRRSNRSRDALSPENSPFQMDGPSEVRFSETLKNPSEDTKGFEDSQVISSFESRIQALQQKARGLPRPHMESSWPRNRDPSKGGGSLIVRQDFQEQAPGYNGYGSPSTELSHWRSQVRNSPDTGRSQRSDETLASRISNLEDSFARIEFMLQQVLGIAGSQMQMPRVNSRSPQSRVDTWPIGPLPPPGLGGGCEVVHDKAAETRKGFFKWPMDIAEATELARLRQAKAASHSA